MINGNSNQHTVTFVNWTEAHRDGGNIVVKFAQDGEMFIGADKKTCYNLVEGTEITMTENNGKPYGTVVGCVDGETTVYPYGV